MLVVTVGHPGGYQYNVSVLGVYPRDTGNRNGNLFSFAKVKGGNVGSVTDQVIEEIAAEIDDNSPVGTLKFVGDEAFKDILSAIFQSLLSGCLGKLKPDAALKVCQQPKWNHKIAAGAAIRDTIERSDFRTRREFRREVKRIKEALFRYGERNLDGAKLQALIEENS